MAVAGLYRAIQYSVSIKILLDSKKGMSVRPCRLCDGTGCPDRIVFDVALMTYQLARGTRLARGQWLLIRILEHLLMR